MPKPAIPPGQVKTYGVTMTFVSESSGYKNILTAQVDGTTATSLKEYGKATSFFYSSDKSAYLELAKGPAQDSRVKYYVDNGDGLFNPTEDTLIFDNVLSKNVSLEQLRKAADGKAVFGAYEDLLPTSWSPEGYKPDNDFDDFVVKLEFDKVNANAGIGNKGEPNVISELNDIDPGNSGLHNRAAFNEGIL